MDEAPPRDELTGGPQSFALAPMGTSMRLSTIVCLLVPVFILYRSASTPPVVRAILVGSTIATVALYAGIWSWLRPRRFEVSQTALRIVWPLRTREIARSAISGVELIAGEEFRRRHGFGVRLGVGGLWGGFGLLQTGDQTFSMWISRRDAMVIVRLAGGDWPLLLTPVSPDRFVAALSTR